jgi:hypothetical protein
VEPIDRLTREPQIKESDDLFERPAGTKTDE